MKTLKILLVTALGLILFACSDEKMDEIDMERNDALNMEAGSILPDAILKTAFETTGCDIAWYSTVYIEHSAGTWAQSAVADKRQAQNDASLFNNNWNGLYDVLYELKDILTKTAPDGTEPENYWARGIAQVLTAYNLAVATDMWGEVPWTEALMGAEILQPKYDKQSELYPKIQALLDDAIVNLGKTVNKLPAADYIYGGDQNAWIKAAWSLKARYAMRLSKINSAAAATEALNYLANGFASADDNFIFDAFEPTASGENPWYQFLNDRTHLSAGQTLYNLMTERNDPRIAAYFTQVEGAYNPAPNGTAVENQGGMYSTSLITENGMTAPIPLMTYHELKFIEAEAKLMKGDASWQMAFGEAIAANFTFHGVDGAADYIINQVAPRVTPGNELKELITQKYIAFYEFEAIEAYNDYRRTGIPTMHNPNNATTGFVNRFPFALSEVSSNPDNVPAEYLSDPNFVYNNKVWWAGGQELKP
ncbi:MAG: SusD/RagB family nutrient-binding outer membrane lipoprotein [Bacteroidales bacterium]|nr:SusD/RagB family nutrient-binding outer membrane lipoprotein [Bacteroidales bacterium]